MLVAAAPADVDVQHDAGGIAPHVLTQLVGVVEFTALTVGGVAAAAVFAGGSGTEHHNIRLALGIAVAAAVTLTVGPAVLAVPGLAAVPGGADGLAGIERGNGAAAVLTVGVLEQAAGGIIRGGVVQIAVHQLVQNLKQRAVGHTAGVGRAGIGRQLVVGDVVVVVPILRHRRQEGGQLIALTPVVDVVAGIDVVDRCRLGR